MPAFEVLGASAHFHDTFAPRDRTVVFLHGAGGSHRVWRSQWAELKGAARLVVPDLPGHGLSAGPARGSIAEYVRWTGAFLRETAPGPVVLAGHSMGGAIALQAALEGAVPLAALVLVATGARLRVSPAVMEGVAGRFADFAPDLAGWMLPGDASPELREEVVGDLLAADPASLLADFRACDGFDVRERLGEIRLPALVIAGDQDRLTPVRYAEFLAARIPGAVLKIVRGAGHLPMLERPREVNAVIRAFLHSLA